MLLVKTEVKSSPIHGRGLYAAEDIAQGARVFRWSYLFGWSIAAGDFNGLRDEAQAFLRKYGWRGRDKEMNQVRWFLDLDDSRYLNHSFAPNLIVEVDPVICGYASKHIYAGEELTEDYSAFDLDYHTYAGSLR